jgi:hypothetical protein
MPALTKAEIVELTLAGRLDDVCQYAFASRMLGRPVERCRRLAIWSVRPDIFMIGPMNLCHQHTLSVISVIVQYREQEIVRVQHVNHEQWIPVKEAELQSAKRFLWQWHHTLRQTKGTHR